MEDRALWCEIDGTPFTKPRGRHIFLLLLLIGVVVITLWVLATTGLLAEALIKAGAASVILVTAGMMLRSVPRDSEKKEKDPEIIKAQVLSFSWKATVNSWDTADNRINSYERTGFGKDIVFPKPKYFYRPMCSEIEVAITVKEIDVFDAEPVTIIVTEEMWNALSQGDRVEIWLQYGQPVRLKN